MGEPRMPKGVTVGPLVDIYTDGSCRPNPGPGGWGVLIMPDSELFGGVELATNNRMELMAAIRGLESLNRSCTVRLHTDSQYVQQGITLWIRRWKLNGWRNSQRKPVSNVDLWRRLDVLNQRHDIEWVWVRGHDGDEGNERADALAKRGRMELM